MPITNATPPRVTLYQDNTQEVQIFGLRDADTQVFLNAASIEATLLDEDRNEVSGLVGIQLVYVPGSNGNYSGVVGADFEPPVGSNYTLVIDGDQGASHLHMEITTSVKVRVS